MAIKNSETAFPANGSVGLTKNEYFLAAALTGLMANPAFINPANYELALTFDQIGQAACDGADAAIKEHNEWGEDN